MARVGDGGGAHGQEHRVEEGERADSHGDGVYVRTTRSVLLIARGGAGARRAMTGTKQAVAQCSQQQRGEHDDPEDDAAADAEDRGSALGEKE